MCTGCARVCRSPQSRARRLTTLRCANRAGAWAAGRRSTARDWARRGRSVTAITAPGRTPSRVAQFRATGLGHSLAEATDALTAGLGLTQPGAGRLLAIASDGYYAPGEAARAAERITALRQAGCTLLWLPFDLDPCPLPGTTLLQLTDPAQAATAIAQAATAALAATI